MNIFKNKRIFVLGLSMISILMSTHCTHFVLFKKQSKSLKIGFIVPTGGARTLSAIGVLQVLQDYNIPIDHVIGMGWGAWVAAAYAKNQSIDEVRWSLYKLEKRGYFKNLKNKKMSYFEDELKENFASITKTAINFSCPSLNYLGLKVWKTNKTLLSAVRSCLPFPSFFNLTRLLKDSSKSFFHQRKGFMTAPLSMVEAKAYLRKKGVNLILWLNPMSTGGLEKTYNPFEFLLWTQIRSYLNQIKDEPDVIQIIPKIHKFSIYDFHKIDEIIELGKQEGSIIVKKIKERHSLFDFKKSLYKTK